MCMRGGGIFFVRFCRVSILVNLENGWKLVKTMHAQNRLRCFNPRKTGEWLEVAGSSFRYFNPLSCFNPRKSGEWLEEEGGTFGLLTWLEFQSS